MSVHLRNLAIEAYRATAEAAFQSGSKLRDRVMVISGVEAEKQRFPVIGVTDANQRQSGADVTPTNVGNAKPEADLTPDEAFDYLDRQDTALTNVDAMRGYGMSHGKAVSRQFDAKIVAALAVAYANSQAYKHPGMTAVNNVNVASGGKFDAAAISAIAEALMEWDFDPTMEEVTLVYPASRFSDMAEETKFASMDYMQGTGAPGVTKTGRFEEIYGMKPIFIGNKGRRAGKGKLQDNRAWAFCRRAVGLAVGTTERMGVVEWVPQKRSWLVGAECNSGAVKIQEAGVVQVTFQT